MSRRSVQEADAAAASESSSLPSSVDVLIVGSGMVGMTSALSLLQQDLPPSSILHVDSQVPSKLSLHPRARGLHPRTVEIFRQLGGVRLQEGIAWEGRKTNNVGGWTYAPSMLDYASWAKRKKPSQLLRRAVAFAVALLGLAFAYTSARAAVHVVARGLSAVLPLSRRGLPASLLAGALLLAVSVAALAMVARRLYESWQMASRFIFCTQDLLEPLLMREMRERGLHTRFETQLRSFQVRHDDSVTAELFDTRTQRASSVHAQYLLACDGSHSTVRRLLDIPFLGPNPGPFADAQVQHLNLYFRCDLTPLVAEHGFSVLNIRSSHPALPLGRALFASVNHRDRWVLQVPVPEGSAKWDEVERNYPEERCLDMIRAALLGDSRGDPGPPGAKALAEQMGPITLLGRQSWRAHTRLAATYRPSRRIFLLGDAGHLNPPWGGFGATTGVADAQNLGWKVAAVLKGQVGDTERLLETYEVERREQARLVGAIAVSFNDEVGLAPYGTWPFLMKVLRNLPNLPKVLGVGYGYSSAAVYRRLHGDGSTSESAPLGPGDSRLRGEAGSRVPHVALQQPWPQQAVGQPLDDIPTTMDSPRTPSSEASTRLRTAEEAQLAAALQRRAANAASRSSLDVCHGPGLTLLAGPEAEALVLAVESNARQLHIPLRVFRAGQDIHYEPHANVIVAAFVHHDLSHSAGNGSSGQPQVFWPPVFGTARDGGLLIRPDQFVAGACQTTTSTSCSAAQAADRWAQSSMRQVYCRGEMVGR